MALNSSDVNAGDDILAVHNNNLIDDIEQHIHEGTDTTKVKAENLDVSTGDVPADGVATASIEDDAVTPAKLDDGADFTVNKLLATQGLSTAGNEYLLWDVVYFSLDGTSSDNVAYVSDESKAHGLLSCGHDTATLAESHSDVGISGYNYANLQSDQMYVYYSSIYGAADALEVIVFYTL